VTQEFTGDAQDAVERGFRHLPVLLEEVLEQLDPRRGQTIVDCTLGLGGHSYEIARRLGREGRLIAFDRDEQAMGMAKERLSHPPAELAEDWPQIEYISAAFHEIGERVQAGSVDGVLADIGVSSLQLDNAERGFSFQADGPLDMRMDRRRELSANEVVNQFDEGQLADLIYTYANERRSRRIARAICRARPIHTTSRLAEVVSAAARPINQAERRIHPATLTFQAIRIFVNGEMDELEALVAPSGALKCLKAGGKLAVISFHSTEDRIVKDALRDGAKANRWQVLTKKPIIAGDVELQGNPRSRSAKLRAAEKLK